MRTSLLLSLSLSLSLSLFPHDRSSPSPLAPSYSFIHSHTHTHNSAAQFVSPYQHLAFFVTPFPETFCRCIFGVLFCFVCFHHLMVAVLGASSGD